MNCRIAPSILSSDPADYRTSVKQMVDAGADWIHFDVMDGQFVPPITFGADLVASLRRDSKVKFEAHLMTLTPERHFQSFVEAGCQRIIFHSEATYHSHRLVQHLRESGVEAGLALNPATPASVVEPLVQILDLVLVMTVNPGWGGQSLIESCVDKVKAIRAMAPHLEIEVDGGVDPSTIGCLAEAGAGTFVTGSFLMRSGTIAGNMKELRDACGSKS